MTSSDIARRILTEDAGTSVEKDSKAAGLALQRSLLRVTDGLRDAMGEVGCAALLSRAFARTEREHPALKSLRGPGDDEIGLNRVAASVETHGIAAVTSAVEALVAALIDILTRLIGEDMAVRLINYVDTRPPRGGGAGAA